LVNRAACARIHRSSGPAGTTFLAAETAKVRLRFDLVADLALVRRERGVVIRRVSGELSSPDVRTDHWPDRAN
jgi:hypothetical protein